MKNERGTEASKTIKYLKVCHNKQLSKRRVLQLLMSSWRAPSLLPLMWNSTSLQHIIVFLIVVPGSLKQLLLPYWLNISAHSLLKRRRQILASVHQAVCTYNQTHEGLFTWCCTYIYVYIYAHTDIRKNFFPISCSFFNVFYCCSDSLCHL